MQVELLPYLTHPVKNHTTVYTAMRNFINISKQLEREYLPVHCNERVHCIDVYIILKHPAEFQFTVPMMGGFQMAQTAMYCIGKFFAGAWR